MDQEFVEMSEEIERIANSTAFNNIRLLNSASQSIAIHFGGTDDYITVPSTDMTRSALGIAPSMININSMGSAREALAILDSAINSKDTARARFGYKMNRLEGTISVLDIQRENLMASESRVSDVDVATEMAEMTRNQVLAQAGISMLAQANAMPQMALTLLRG
jgi:flagellin